MVNQAYQLLFSKLDDDDAPFMIECGGHDGNTKFLLLKVS